MPLKPAPITMASTAVGVGPAEPMVVAGGSVGEVEWCVEDRAGG